MANENDQQNGPRDGGSSDGQTEQVSSGGAGTGPDSFGQDQRSSEGEPGRSRADSTGGQTEAQTSDVADPGESDSRV
jgi:hypothetical protein